MNPVKLVAVVMLVSLTFGAGVQVNREHLTAVLRNAGLLFRAFLANFVLVPIYGVVIVRLFRIPADVATGVLLMAIAPGVPFVLASVRKRGGRLGLAVALEFFLPLLSVVTVPLTASLVLPPDARAQLPIQQFLTTLLLFQLAPLAVGIVVGGRIPQATPMLERISNIIFIVSTLALLVLLGPKIYAAVASVQGSGRLLAILCIVVLSAATGWLLGSPAPEDRRVLSIGTALRNVGLCALIAATSFKESEPAVVSYLLVQMVVSTALGVFYARSTKGKAA